MTLTPVVTMLLAAAAGVAVTTGKVAPAEDAGWPCDAAAPPLAAPATYWPDIARPAASGWSADPAIVTLAQTAARRSVEETEAVAQVRRFAATRGTRDDRARLAAALIDQVDGERRTIVDGIRRFNTRQTQLAKRIEEGYTALDTKGGAATAEQRAAIEEQAGWDQRIFEDRQRMLPIICRQPAALERRLTALLAALKP